MISVFSPTVHAVGSVATGTIAAVVTTSHYGVTPGSLGLVILGAGIPSAVAVFLANRGQKAAAMIAMNYATEAANRVVLAREAATAAAAMAAEAVLTEAGRKAHAMLEEARIQAAAVIATGVPVAKAVIEVAAVEAAKK